MCDKWMNKINFKYLLETFLGKQVKLALHFSRFILNCL
ncbi:hypothetical protein NT05LI_0493 [Listeria ivanovii FSL F6-596]|nr:hypothetical protein NT05LI_0493 [Listeria ivanovii FSL F6-596]